MCHCLVCGEAPAVLHIRARTRLIPQNYRITEEDHTPCWDIWRCTQCGFIFSDWKLSEEELRRLYATMQDELYEREEQTRRLTFQRGLSFLGQWTQPSSSAHKKLLDVGCATGGFLLEARARGWTVEGADLSAWAVGRAHAHGLAVHQGTIHSLPSDVMRFDAITMLDYIEHDPDPALLLDRARELLRPGGCVYITTPDIGGRVARLLGGKWWGINPLHLHYFSRASLRSLLEQHEFQVVVARAYTRVFTAEYWASRLEHFHPSLARWSVKGLKRLKLAEKHITLNLGDMMEVIARKKADGNRESGM